MATFASPRKLSARELLPAVGVGVGVGLGAGLVAGYVARLFLMREKLRGGRDAPRRALPPGASAPPRARERG